MARSSAGVLVNRDGVQVDDAENALVIVLDAHPVLERAQIISDVQIAGRLHAGEDSCFHGKGMGVNSIVSNFEVDRGKAGLRRRRPGSPGGPRGVRAFRAAGRAHSRARRGASSRGWCGRSTLEVLEPAPERVAAPCPVFGRCGGCHYQHAPYEYQLAAKRAILADQLRRLGKMEPPEEIAVAAGRAVGLPQPRAACISKGGASGTARPARTACARSASAPSLRPKINEAIGALAGMLRDSRWPRFVRSLEIFTDERQVQLNVLDTGPAGGEALLRLVRGDRFRGWWRARWITRAGSA